MTVINSLMSLYNVYIAKIILLMINLTIIVSDMIIYYQIFINQIMSQNL